MNPSIFKAYDIRGKVGDELNDQVMKLIGQAMAEWLPNKGPIAIGYDMRPDSKELAEALMDGLTEQGRDVMNIGRVASDMIYFATGNYDMAGGCVVTASHNPGEYNGIKLCRELARPIGEDSGLYEIRDMALKNDFTPADTKGSVTEKDVMADWVEHALSFTQVDQLKKYRIAVDAANGMGGLVMPVVAKMLPSFEITELYYELDGTFPNHEANPLKLETLVDLQKVVSDKQLDFGIAFDGDGDRAGLIDEKGDVVSGSVITAILTEYFLSKHPGATILYNAICSNVVPELIEQRGGVGVRTRVGHSFIKGKMQEHSAVFAGEHSGHYYFKDNYNADSGLIAVIAVIEVLNQTGGTLSELADKYRTYISISETNFEVDDKQAVIEKVADVFEDEAQSIDRLDGITVRLSDELWFNLRPSNTEPLLRMNAEAKTQEELDQLVERVKQSADL